MERSNFIYIENPDISVHTNKKTDLKGQAAMEYLITLMKEIDPTGFVYVGTKQEPGASADFVLTQKGYMGSTNHRYDYLDE